MRVNKRILKPTLTVLFAAFALTLSLVAFATMNGSVAWFTGNRSVDAESMTAEVLAPVNGVVEKVEYFAIDSITLGGTAGDTYNQYIFNGAAGQSPSLATYSPLSSERQVLIKVTMLAGVTSVTLDAISALSEHPYLAPDAFPAAAGNSLSTVVQFVALSSDQVTLQTDTDGNVIAYEVGRFDEVADIRHFVTVDDTGTPTGFDGSLRDVMNVDFTGADGFHEGYQGVLYILIDYHAGAAEFMQEKAAAADLESDPVTGEIKATFDCDFSFYLYEG